MRRRASDKIGSLLFLAALFWWGKKMTQPSGPAATRTPAKTADVEAALIAAGAPLGAVKILTAMSAHETAGWAGLWNWNVGNITTAGPNYVIQPGVALHFAAYPTLAAGAKAFVDLLRAPMYSGAIALAEVGDLAGFVAALKKGGYAGNADYVAYEAGIARWMATLTGISLNGV
jgi:hypothetical protein